MSRTRWESSFKRYDQSARLNDRRHLPLNENLASRRVLLHRDPDRPVQFGERFAVPHPPASPYVALRSSVTHRGDAPRSCTPRDVLRVNRVLHPLALIEQ